MKSWECDCGRINPPAEKKCLSCEALRSVENMPFRPMNLQWTEEEIQNICNKYSGNPTKCLSPSGEVKIPTKILVANPAGDFDEVWMKTTDDLCVLVKKGDKWADHVLNIEMKPFEDVRCRNCGAEGYGQAFSDCSKCGKKECLISKNTGGILHQMKNAVNEKISDREFVYDISIRDNELPDDDKETDEFWQMQLREKAKELLKKHWVLSGTTIVFDEIVIHHLKYAIDAIVEALEYNNLKSK